MDFGTGHDALADEHHEDGGAVDNGDLDQHSGADPEPIGHMGEQVDGGLSPAIFDELIHDVENLVNGHSGQPGDHAPQLDPGQPAAPQGQVPHEDPMDSYGWEHPDETGTGPHPDNAGPGPDPANGGPDGDGVDGNPQAWTNDWFFQETDGYCGPSSIAQVVSEYTGLDVHDPQQLVDRAGELGLIDPDHPENGMTWDGMQTLMQDQGVPCHLQNSSMQDLESKLDEGYGVIAMVHAGDIWGEEHDGGQGADHALVVAGIDHEHGTVILSDPGSPNGNQEEVPIDQFEQAWSASGDEMLVADNPDADLASTSTAAPTAAALESTPWAIANLTGAS